MAAYQDRLAGSKTQTPFGCDRRLKSEANPTIPALYHPPDSLLPCTHRGPPPYTVRDVSRARHCCPSGQMKWIFSPSCFPPRSLLSASPLLCLPVCFHESGSSCLCSLRCWLLTYDLSLAFSFLLSPHRFLRIPPVGSFFLVYERLRTLAP